jgi:hypothetical protein
MTAKTEVLKLVPLRSIDDRKLPRMEDGKEWPSPSIQRSSKLKFEATATYTSPSWVSSELAILCLGKAIGLRIQVCPSLFKIGMKGLTFRQA